MQQNEYQPGKQVDKYAKQQKQNYQECEH